MEDQRLKKKKVTSPPRPTRSGTTNGPVSQKGASEVTEQHAECPGLFRAKKKKKKPHKKLVRHQREGPAYLKIFAKAESKVLRCVCSARVCFSEFRSRVVGSCHQPGGGSSNLGPWVHRVSYCNSKQLCKSRRFCSLRLEVGVGAGEKASGSWFHHHAPQTPARSPHTPAPGVHPSVS